MKPETVEKTRQRLIELATATLARDATAPMSAIAAAAGVGRATLHRYFPRREDLLREIALEAIRKTHEVVAPVYADARSALDALERTIHAIVPLGGSYHFLTTEASVNQDPAVAAAYERQTVGMRELTDMLKAEGSLAADVPTAWFVAAFDGLIYAAWKAVAEGDIAPNDAGALVFRTLIEGLQLPTFAKANAKTKHKAKAKAATKAKNKTRAKAATKAKRNSKSTSKRGKR